MSSWTDWSSGARARAARSRADQLAQLARITWTEELRHDHSDPDRDARYARLTPVRWVRLA